MYYETIPKGQWQLPRNSTSLNASHNHNTVPRTSPSTRLNPVTSVKITPQSSGSRAFPILAQGLAPQQIRNQPSLLAESTMYTTNNATTCIEGLHIHGNPYWSSYSGPDFGLHFITPSTSHHLNNKTTTEHLPGPNSSKMVLGTEYGYNEYPTHQSSAWSSLSPSPVFSSDSHGSAFNSKTQPQTFAQGLSLSSPQTPQLTVTNGEVPINQSLEPIKGDVRLTYTCSKCSAEYQHHSAWIVHIWDKHPTTGWSPQTCLWEGCVLNKRFNTHSTWLEHVRNVHQKRYRCDFPGCTLAKPFGSKHMLVRHYNSKHGEKKPCTKANCQAPKSNLCRTDKLGEHQAKWHGPLECKVADCPRRRINGENHGFTHQSDLEKHMRRKHPDWGGGNHLNSN